MSKNEKVDCPRDNDDQENIHWFESYKHSKTKPLERLKNKDILNYIKDVEQNCRLEMSSGDEDYAGTKESSNCSASSGTRFKSIKKVKSKITLRKNKNVTWRRERKRFSDHNITDDCNYCCSARKSDFHCNSDLINQEKSRRNLNISTKSIYQHPNLSKNSYKYCESSPTFRDWYSRNNNKIWPAITEMTNLKVTKDWSQNVNCDSRISRSQITNKNELGDSCYVNTCPNIASNDKTTERNPHYRIRKHKRKTRMRKLNEESDVSDFEDQQPLNKIYSSRDALFSYQAPLQNGDYKGRYTSRYCYPVRRSRQPTSWSLNSRSNRLIASARLPETSSLWQGQISQWENEVRPPLKASSFITGTSINRSYQRETNRKNNTNQRRRRPNILRDRESLCYHRPGLLRESGRLCKVAPTYEDKQWLGYRREDSERDEMDRCCPENENNLIRLQRKNTCSPVSMSKRVNYTAAISRRTLLKSVQPRENDERESEINLSMEEDLQNEDVMCDNTFDVIDNERTNNYNDAIDLRNMKPRISFLADRTHHGSSKLARKHKKLNNDLRSNQEEAMRARTALRKKITARYPTDKEFSFAIKTHGKSVPRDSSGLRYDATESTCDCKEPFYDPPATCLIGSCTCIGNGEVYSENADRNNSDSSRRISDTIYCCCYCSCSSSHNETNPVKKLESFYERERAKAVNQDISHKPSKSCNIMRTNTRKCAHGDSDERNQSEFNIQRDIRRKKSIDREWLTNPTRLRLEKQKHGGASLEKILIYPSRRESGPPLMLYKRSSNISCHVKGDADTGFRYSVTYVQKFASPTWMSNSSPEILLQETDKECNCSADYG